MSQAIEGLPKGACRPYADAVRLGLIDPPIRSLMDAFNADSHHVKTKACCGGHGYLGRYYRAPYVLFEAPVSAAARFDALLRDSHCVPRSGLQFIWEVEGHFDDERLYFTLSPNNLSRYRFVPRRWLDRDFRILESLVPDLLASARGEKQ